MKEREEYLEERNKALLSLDMEWAREMLPSAEDDEARLVAMHKARYDCVVLDRGARMESGEWLRVRGHRRMTQEPILTKGELPQSS